MKIANTLNLQNHILTKRSVNKALANVYIYYLLNTSNLMPNLLFVYAIIVLHNNHILPGSITILTEMLLDVHMKEILLKNMTLYLSFYDILIFVFKISVI